MLDSGVALIALVLGFAFPGFGQALAGRWRLGLAVALAVQAVHMLVLVSPWLLVPIMAVRLGVAIHGAMLVRGRAGGPRWNSAFGVVAVCVGAFLVLRLYVVELFRVASSSMAPTLQVHDRFVVNKLARSIARGDLIAFWYPCSPDMQYAKRVVGVAGDTVEVRCEVLYVNGKAVPHEPVGACAYLDLEEENDTWLRRQCRESREELGGHHYRVYDSAVAPDPGGSPRDFPVRDDRPSCADTADSAPTANPLATAGKIVGARVDGSCMPQMHYVVPAGGLFVVGDNRYNSNDSRVWGPVPEDAVIGTITGIWWPDGNNGSRIGRIE